MIAVAAIDAKRRGEPANLFDAFFQRVAGTGDEVAGDHGQVGSEVVGHIHGAANLGARHVTAQVNVTQLNQLHAIERRGQIGNRNIHAVNLIVEAFGGEAVHHAKKRRGSSGRGGSLEEIASAGIRGDLRLTRRGGWLIARFIELPDPIQPVHALHRKVREQHTEKPQSCKNIQKCAAGKNTAVAVTQRVRQADDNQQKPG